MCNGKEYTEVCNYQRPNCMMRFYFVTRCYSSYMETIIANLSQPPHPDEQLSLGHHKVWMVLGGFSDNRYVLVYANSNITGTEIRRAINTQDCPEWRVRVDAAKVA